MQSRTFEADRKKTLRRADKEPDWLSLLSITTDIYLHALALLHNNYCDDLHRLRLLTQPYGVVKVDASPGVIQITF